MVGLKSGLKSEDARLWVFTYKAGLLSAVAHDLKIEATRLKIEVTTERAIRLEVDARSLRVCCAMRDECCAPGVLSSDDKKTIDERIAKEVLDIERHSMIRFSSASVRTIDERTLAIDGTLTLHGKSRALSARAMLEKNEWIARVTLHQPDFGIKPYTAMFKTLAIKPDVVVEIRVPTDG